MARHTNNIPATHYAVDAPVKLRAKYTPEILNIQSPETLFGFICAHITHYLYLLPFSMQIIEEKLSLGPFAM
jgi:hypothetical protein